MPVSYTHLDVYKRQEHEWADGLGIDSSHLVWIQLHEDLLASLGLDRADEV